MTKEGNSHENKTKNPYEEEFEDFKKQLGESVDLEFLEDFPENSSRKNTDIPFPYGSTITRPYNFH